MKNPLRAAALLILAALLCPVCLSSCVKDDPVTTTAAKTYASSTADTAALPTDTPTAETATPANPNAIRILRLSKNGLTLKIGRSEKLSFTASPASADTSGLYWVSDDPITATVDADGRVTAVNIGRTTVRLVTADGSLSVECTVVVTDEEMTVIPVVSVKFADPVIVLTEGGRESAVYSVLPLNATDRSVDFYTEDVAIAKVDGSGKVEGVKAGLTKLTAKSGGVTGSCVVLVKHSDGSLPAEARKEVSVVEGSKRSLEIGKAELNRIEGLTYSSADPSVASVLDGIVTGVVKGKTAIEVKYKDKKVIYQFDLTVVGKDEAGLPIEGISLDRSSVTLEVGEKTKLKATLLPEGAKKEKIVWICENKEIYSVSESGEITALKAGSAIVTAYVSDGERSFTKTCQITVREKGSPDVVRVTGITVVNDRLEMKVGQQMKIEYVVMPKDATNKNVIFIIEPSDGDKTKDYVTVSDTGVVTALRPCKGYITVYISDNGKSFTKGVRIVITE